MFCKKVVLKHFVKFTGKHLCQSIFSNKAAGLRISREFYETFKKTFFIEYLGGCFRIKVLWEFFSTLTLSIKFTPNSRLRISNSSKNHPLFNRFILIFKLFLTKLSLLSCDETIGTLCHGIFYKTKGIFLGKTTQNHNLAKLYRMTKKPQRIVNFLLYSVLQFKSFLHTVYPLKNRKNAKISWSLSEGLYQLISHWN